MGHTSRFALGALCAIFSATAFAGGEMISQRTTTERTTIQEPYYPPELESRYQHIKTQASSSISSYYQSSAPKAYDPCTPYGVPGGFGYNASDRYPNLGIGIYGSGPDMMFIGNFVKHRLPGPGLLGFTSTP